MSQFLVTESAPNVMLLLAVLVGKPALLSMLAFWRLLRRWCLRRFEVQFGVAVFTANVLERLAILVVGKLTSSFVVALSDAKFRL